MGKPPAWGVHAPAANGRYQIEFKLTDPPIPYANITFAATNQDTGAKATLPLPPIGGDSGLHYSANSALARDGSYAATVTVDVSEFMCELKDKGLWVKLVSTGFHFRFQDGKVAEVSEPR